MQKSNSTLSGEHGGGGSTKRFLQKSLIGTRSSSSTTHSLIALRRRRRVHHGPWACKKFPLFQTSKISCPKIFQDGSPPPDCWLGGNSRLALCAIKNQITKTHGKTLPASSVSELRFWWWLIGCRLAPGQRLVYPLSLTVTRTKMLQIRDSLRSNRD